MHLPPPGLFFLPLNLSVEEGTTLSGLVLQTGWSEAINLLPSLSFELLSASGDDFEITAHFEEEQMGPDGWLGYVWIEIFAINDDLSEEDEEFSFTLSVSHPNWGSQTGDYHVTIVDDDPKVTVVLAAGGSELAIFEGQPGGSVTIRLSKAATTDVDVRIESDQPWEQDFQLLTSVRIPAGQTSITIPIAQAFLDTEAEPNEQFTLRFSAVKAGSTNALSFDNNVIELNVRDEALTDTPGQKALDVINKVFLIRPILGEALQNIGNAPPGSEWAFFKTQLQDKVLERTLKVIDVGTAVAAFGTDYVDAKGNPAKQNLAAKKLFTHMVDAYVAAEALASGTAAAGAILALAPTLPIVVPFLTLVAVGGIATWAYSEYLSPIVKTYAGKLWDEAGTYEAPRQVLHGPVAGANVFLDVDGDGALGPDELGAVSDGRGWFTLPFGPGTIVSIGGTDTATGLSVALPLRAPEGSAIVSPLSTLAVALVAQGDDGALAFSGLGLAPPTNLAEFNPIAAAMGGDAAALAQFAADGQLYASALAISKALAASSSYQESTTADAAFAALADRIGALQPGQAFELTSVDDIAEWVGATANALGISGFVPGGLLAMATVVAGFNHLMAQALFIQDPSMALATIIQAQKVAEGTVAVAIQQMAAGQLSPESLVNAYTGANLEALVLPPAQASIAATSAVHLEGTNGSTALTFTVTQSGDLSVAHDVSWTVAGSGVNPATGADFASGVPPLGTLTFAAGEASKTITILVTGDATIETDETFTVALSNASVGLTIGVAAATGTIQNDDFPVVSIAPLSATKTEGNSGTTPFTFAVTRTGDLAAEHSVSWSIVGSGVDGADPSDIGGTALNGGTLTFAAGETTRTILVEVAGDTEIEFDEEFTVSLHNPSVGLLISTSSAIGTIENDDGNVVSIAALSAAKAEENSGTTSFTFTVTLNQTGVTAQTIDWTVTGSAPNAADAADFGGTLPSGSVTFAAGETSKTITLPVSGDSIVEPDNFFTVTLSSPSTGLSLGQATAVGIVQNDDRADISIAALAAAEPEGNSGTTSFTFTVSLDQASFEGQTADWTVTGAGTNAANAADFDGMLPSGTVSFAAGETSKVVTVPVSGDIAVESDESFAVTLSNVSAGLLLGTASASGTIQNDDRSTVSIVAASAVKVEGNSATTSFTFTVNLNQAGVAGQTVAWAVTGSGATAADALDFAGGLLPAETVTFATGETTKTVTVGVADDVFVEADESFTVTLSDPTSGLTLGTASATGTIQNDDVAAVVTAHGDAYIVHEGQVLTVILSAGLLANDLNASTASLLGGPAHGSLQLVGSGNFSYMPAAGFHGIDSFTYQAGNNGSSMGNEQAVLYVVPVNVGATTTLDLLALTAEEQIAATYVAFFGRAADAGGFGFWVNQFITGLPVQGPAALFANIASSFGISNEAKALYPFLTNPFGASDSQISAFLDSVYNNMFNRSSDAEGLGYWTGQIKQTLQAGQFVGSILVHIMGGAQDTVAGQDITTLMGKVAVSLDYVQEQREHSTLWLGPSDVAAATTLLQSVTADPLSVLVGVRNAETLIAAHA